jgi:hypothetical protein
MPQPIQHIVPWVGATIRFANPFTVLSIFFMIMIFIFSASPDSTWGQGRQIRINPEYAFPTKETSPGVEVNSASLVENANAWNWHVIKFTGEAVGEHMIRGKMAWLHLNDDPYMSKHIEEGAELGGYNSGHAVWVSADQARKILMFGDYKHAGDIVTVTGTFNATCREHGGDMDIHASSLQVVRTGHTVDPVPDKKRAAVAAGLFILAGALFGFRRIAERHRI